MFLFLLYRLKTRALEWTARATYTAVIGVDTVTSFHVLHCHFAALVSEMN